MKLSTIGLSTATAALLGVLAVAPAAHATEIKDQAKDTNTQVTIVDDPNPGPGSLLLTHVPDKYEFNTKLSDKEYSINGSLNKENDKITIFNTSSKQEWSVKADVVDKTLTTSDNKTATVTGFKINGQDLMGEKANKIVHKSAEKPDEKNNTGHISKEVTKDGLSISFSDKDNALKAGDVLTGKVHYQLFNTPNAE